MREAHLVIRHLEEHQLSSSKRVQKAQRDGRDHRAEETVKIGGSISVPEMDRFAGAPTFAT